VLCYRKIFGPEQPAAGIGRIQRHRDEMSRSTQKGRGAHLWIRRKAHPRTVEKKWHEAETKGWWHHERQPASPQGIEPPRRVRRLSVV